MFEGKLPLAPESRDSATGEMPEEVLCELRWSDLVARLSAARELRAELAASDETMLASFDADSARHLASHHEGLHDDNNEPDVNPDDSGNRKGQAAINQIRADHDKPATRGNI